MRFILVGDTRALNKLLSNLPQTISLDTEYSGLDPRTAELKTVVIGVDGDTAYSVPAEFVKYLSSLSLAKEIRLQNFKVDFKILSRHGLDLSKTRFRDSMLMHHLIDENAPHSLDYMVKTYYGDDYKETFWGKYQNYEDAPEGERLEYECKDACYTYRLVDEFNKSLKEKEFLVNHVHELALALYRTEEKGVRVDFDLMLKTEQEYSAKINALLPVMRRDFLEYCLTWEMEEWQKELDKRKTLKGKAQVKRPSFNFGSDKQLAWLFYDRLKLPVLKRTKKTPKGGGGSPSVDYEAIELLKAQGNDLGSVGEYKEIKNLYATFCKGLIGRVQEGRIYPEFNVNGTVTGRISHSNPNMGNMPSDGPFRNFFLPEEGMVIVGADYDQLEVVLEASITGDRNLAKIILEGLSKHDITATSLKLPRSQAKTLNFAMQYWCEIPKVAKLLGVSYKEGELVYNKYWETYSGPRELKRVTDNEVDEGKVIVNLFGRERHLPIAGLADWQIGKVKRQAYNFKIQGPGGEFTNMAFYRWAKHLERTGHGRALWTVHDEVLGCVYPEYAGEEKQTLKTIMESIAKEYKLKLPLKAKPYGPLTCWAKA